MNASDQKQKTTLIRSSSGYIEIIFLVVVLAVVGFVAAYFYFKYQEVARADKNTRFSQQLRDEYLVPDNKEVIFRQAYKNPRTESRMTFPNTYLSTRFDTTSQYWLYKYYDSEATGRILSIANRNSFNQPDVLVDHKRCVPMIEVVARQRPTKPYEAEPIPILVNEDSKEYLYAYTPNIGVCKALYSDEELLQSRSIVMSLRSQY